MEFTRNSRGSFLVMVGLLAPQKRTSCVPVNSPDAEWPIPPCPKCQDGKVVRLCTANGADGVRCYACKTCGYLFATDGARKAEASPDSQAT
jgi:predicted RNA-binding Zn-ribbon protein involved in translation (DUF1610 family)